MRARQSRVTITFYSVFNNLPFLSYFHRSQETIIILSRWKSTWLMKNIKFPQPDVSLQPFTTPSGSTQCRHKGFLPLPLQVICRFHVHFYAPHPYSCNSDSPYNLQKQFAPSSSYFLSNSKTFMPFPGF